MPINILAEAKAAVAVADGKLLERLDRAQASPLAGTRYLLLRLPQAIDSSLTQLFFDLAVNSQLQPILIAPEVHDMFQIQPQRLRGYYRGGARAGVTAESLTGMLGPKARKAARILVESRMVQLMVGRTATTSELELRRGAKVLSRRFGPEVARRMTEIVPAAILAGEPIDFPPPMPPAPPSRLGGLFGRGA